MNAPFRTQVGDPRGCLERLREAAGLSWKSRALKIGIAVGVAVVAYAVVLTL